MLDGETKILLVSASDLNFENASGLS